jgi:hypothetical protein
MARERLALVAADDRVFSALDREVGRLALLVALYPAETGEVFVLSAEFAAVASVVKTLAADAAEAPLQIMVVFVGAVAADAVAIENLLYLVEGRPVDQGVVASLALDAVVGDDAYRIERGPTNAIGRLRRTLVVCSSAARNGSMYVGLGGECCLLIY